METLPLPSEPAPLPPAPVSAHRQVLAAYDRIAEAGRPELWTILRPREEVLVDAKAVDERVRAGESLPLAGLLAAVTDTVDVAGLPTTAACAALDRAPNTSAVAIRRLTEAGAVVLGKTALDRFDFGRTGNPQGAVATDPAEIAGGPSSGAVVAVALDLVDVAIGTGAVGNGVVGLTPTAGLVPGTGMVAGDRVSVFARTIADGQRALAAMTAPEQADPHSRAWPASVRLSAGERPRLAIPDETVLNSLAPPSRAAFRKAIDDLLATGAIVEPVDITAFLEAGHVADRARMEELRAAAAEAMAAYDALLLPAIPDRPDIAETPLDLAVVTVPGVSVVTRAFEDQIALDVAAFLHTEQVRSPYPDTGTDLVVFGAHLRGQPLNSQLADFGARFRGEVQTACRYRMVALPTDPPKPGILPVADGAPLLGERWTISPAGLDSFLAGLAGPQSLGEIELEDGSTAVGVHCTPLAAANARDITEFGDWRAYLRYLTATRPMSC
jgi:allophanate hydrolase